MINYLYLSQPQRRKLYFPQLQYKQDSIKATDQEKLITGNSCTQLIVEGKEILPRLLEFIYICY